MIDNNKRRYILGVMVSVILLILVYLFSRENKITIYIGVANPSSNDIDLLVKIDKSTIFNDTLRYSPFEYEIIKKDVKGGFHKIYVSSDKANLTSQKNILLLFKQHIVIEYFPEIDNQESSSFFIRNRLNPFYLE